MKRFLGVALLLVAGCAPTQPPAAAPTGRWLSASGNVEVTIHPCGQALCGDVSRVLANNSMEAPGAAKVPPAQVGLRIFSDLRRDGAVWTGRLYNREQHRTYDCQVGLQAPNQLIVRGYVVLPLIGKTQLWRRVTA
jgi:uncharacterized protein (DUF2147 family)